MTLQFRFWKNAWLGIVADRKSLEDEQIALRVAMADVEARSRGIVSAHRILAKREDDLEVALAALLVRECEMATREADMTRRESRLAHPSNQPPPATETTQENQ